VHIFNFKYPFLKARFLILLVSFLMLFLSACSSNKNVQNTPEFKIIESSVAKDVKKIGTKHIPIYPGDVFSSEDRVVVSYTKFGNLHGEHKVKWQWYAPDGNLYFSTKNYTIQTTKKKYAEEATVWHKISVKDEKAEELPGKWKVVVYMDDAVISSKIFKIVDDSKFIVDVNIPATGMRNPDAIAVVIGNKYYKHHDIPNVNFARSDAESVKNYLIATLGYKEENIFLELDANKARFDELFGISGEHRGMLFEYIKPSKSDVFVYYSGHGAPDTRTNKGYLMPSDCNPARIAFSGYSLDLFYENLSKLETRKTVVVLDACFSGGTDSGKWLISEASPALIKVENPIISNNTMVVLTSSKGSQISSWYSDKRHGLFTYFFLKAICGAADTDKDKELTFDEIYSYVSDRSEGVPYWAKRLHKGRIQEPTFQGLNTNNVFVKY